MKRRWHLTWDPGAIPRLRLWGGWDDAQHGYVTLELCDLIAGNAIVALHLTLPHPHPIVAGIITWLDERA